jgi:hypothetical protein
MPHKQCRLDEYEKVFLGYYANSVFTYYSLISISLLLFHLTQSRQENASPCSFLQKGADGAKRAEFKKTLTKGIFSMNPIQVACQNLGICNPAIGDDAIAGRIRQNLPPGSYSSLDMRCMSHQFFSTQATVPSRIVRLQPGRPVLNADEILSVNRVVMGVLGSNNPQDQAAVRSALWQSYTITLFVAMDNSYNYDVLLEH